MNSYERIRYERGETRRDAAEGSGVAERTIRALEAGEIAKPSAPIAKALADHYEVTVTELLGVDERSAA